MKALRRLWNFFRPERLGADLDDELRFHLEERVDENIAAGMPEEEARRDARMRFGNPTVLKESTRENDVLIWLETAMQDLRYAVRGLRRSPGFAATAIVSLGLGIGANTAIFSLVDAVILKSLPVPHPEELLQVMMGRQSYAGFTNPTWEHLRDRQDVFSGIFAYGRWGFDLASGGEARKVNGTYVSGQ